MKTTFGKKSQAVSMVIALFLYGEQALGAKLLKQTNVEKAPILNNLA
jgi:hypothetical protein